MLASKFPERFHPSNLREHQFGGCPTGVLFGVGCAATARIPTGTVDHPQLAGWCLTVRRSGIEGHVVFQNVEQGIPEFLLPNR